MHAVMNHNSRPTIWDISNLPVGFGQRYDGRMAHAWFLYLRSDTGGARLISRTQLLSTANMIAGSHTDSRRLQTRSLPSALMRLANAMEFERFQFIPAA